MAIAWFSKCSFVHEKVDHHFQLIRMRSGLIIITAMDRLKAWISLNFWALFYLHENDLLFVLCIHFQANKNWKFFWNRKSNFTRVWYLRWPSRLQLARSSFIDANRFFKSENSMKIINFEKLYGHFTDTLTH